MYASPPPLVYAQFLLSVAIRIGPRLTLSVFASPPVHWRMSIPDLSTCRDPDWLPPFLGFSCDPRTGGKRIRPCWPRIVLPCQLSSRRDENLPPSQHRNSSSRPMTPNSHLLNTSSNTQSHVATADDSGANTRERLNSSSIQQHSAAGLPTSKMSQIDFTQDTDPFSPC